MKKSLILGLILTSLVVFEMCKHNPDPIKVSPKAPTTGLKPAIRDTNIIAMGCNPDTVYFRNTILPIMVSGCATSGCHDAASRQDGLNLTTYAGIVQDIIPGNPNGSKLYKHMVGSGKVMPPSGELPQAQLNLVYTWIAQGAKNNFCNASSNNCDTMNVSYTSALAPIVNTYCKGCHSASIPSGGVTLDTYSGLATVANNGQLVMALTGKLPAMPLYSPELSNCNIGKFRQWIREGAKNN